MYDELVKRLRDAAKMSEALSVFLPHSEGSAVAKLYIEAADAIEELSKRVDESISKDDAEIIIAELSRDLDSMNEANIALYGALPKWISVLDEDPPVGKRVLVTYNFSGSLHIETDTLLANGTWLSLGNVTHWMPLPEPPEEE